MPRGSGPLPKPNARRRNKRASRGTIALERPTMPRTLSAEAQREWRRVVPLLEGMGTISLLDRGVLIRYCTAWADWIDLDEMLQKTGKLVRGRTQTDLVRNPLWLLRRDAEATATELGRLLGLTPDARARAGIKHEAPAPAEEPGNVSRMDDFRKRIGV